MTTCGEEHGRMCEQVSQHDDLLIDLAKGLTDRVSLRLFFWIMSGVFVALLGTATYIYSVEQQLNVGVAERRVLQTNTQHILDTVNKFDRKLDRLAEKFNND